MADKAKSRRRWLQFRLKTLLLVTAVLCVPLAWVGVRMNEKRQERAVIAELERLGADIYYDWQVVIRKEESFVNYDAEPTAPKWLRWLLGDEFFGEVVYVDRFFAFDLDTFSPVNDDDLRLVATFSNLEELDLSYTVIGDEGLAYLKGLAHLRSLDFLECMNITDSGLQHLKSLTTLQHLNLVGTMTTEAGIDDLAKALPGCEIER